MTLKMKVVAGSVLAALLLFSFRPDRTPIQLSELYLPQCEMDERLQTRVTFYIDHAIKGENIESKLMSALDYANQVLSNSCVPMIRTLQAFEYVNFHLVGGEDEYVIHNRLAKAIGESKMSAYQSSLADYYVVVLKDERSVFDDGTTGVADFANNGSRNALLSDKADIHVLEHEFGHIAWAQHKDTWPFPSLESSLKLAVDDDLHHKLKRYARATTCSNAGSIMSYEERILPIYSNPQVRYRGEACGDTEVADNARILREYAIEKMALLQ